MLVSEWPYLLHVLMLWPNSWHKNLRKGLFWLTVQEESSFWWDTHGIMNLNYLVTLCSESEAKDNGWLYISHFTPFTQIMTLSYKMIPLILTMGLPIPINLIEIIPHTVANRLISMLILNPIKLAVKISLHNV